MPANISPEFPLTIFYDGSCPLCAREMAFYRSRVSAARMIFVDISRPDFDAATYGRWRQEFMAALHVLDAGGHFFVGVDAFRALWLAMPDRFYPFLARLTGLPGVYLLARVGYRLFVRWRHLLPR
ncbi:protein of unknown function DUF393 [Syntrophotalea carbinolica DSM 2380]|uniref:DUF393 domain-containing protein n=1 Tax=Syntrophotalea carbinolica (strain DSM 2380 / NBRC 103641 / GraBd1) TaxID=338963 RepID=Q3A0X9_SYNC1|nr:DUF393 domain-containing protein [Syntrophotalea carbinolica]ABA89978.1 protein of unknown function DUF393 [Syntrophotalea carbinolica DSM 2380]